MTPRPPRAAAGGPVRVLIAGAGGQLGRALAASAQPPYVVRALARGALDVSDAEATGAAVRAAAPDVVINAAAYTAVDRAEAEPERAHAVNATGAANLARAAVRAGARFVHVSTDFVFDGAQSRPYLATDAPNPLGAYGASKLAGERLVEEITNGEGVVVRTSWLYAAHGANFVRTMLRLMQERGEVRVVADQVGSPTAAATLAAALWAVVARPAVRGVHHWTDAGAASWYDLAVAVHDEAAGLGLLARPAAVRPIRTQDYPTPARRPAYSVLDKTETWAALGLAPLHWRHALRKTLEPLAGA